MTNETREKLAALRAAGKKLNAATDLSARVVRAVDKVLGEEIGLGISAVAPQSYVWTEADDEGISQEHRARLAYGRIGGKFHIHVLTEIFSPSDAADARPDRPIDSFRTDWFGCPREVKLRSFEGLPDLLSELLSRATELAESTARTADVAGEIVGALNDQSDLAKAAPPPDVSAKSGASPLTYLATELAARQAIMKTAAAWKLAAQPNLGEELAARLAATWKPFPDAGLAAKLAAMPNLGAALAAKVRPLPDLGAGLAAKLAARPNLGAALAANAGLAAELAARRPS